MPNSQEQERVTRVEENVKENSVKLAGMEAYLSVIQAQHIKIEQAMEAGFKHIAGKMDDLVGAMHARELELTKKQTSQDLRLNNLESFVASNKQEAEAEKKEEVKNNREWFIKKSDWAVAFALVIVTAAATALFERALVSHQPATQAAQVELAAPRH